MQFSKKKTKEILDRINIAELIAEYIPLSKRGCHHVGACPFHKDDTPSFTVFAENGRYKCFGCEEKGDAITFLMKIENASYPSAVKRLADRAGVPLPGEAASKDTSVTKRGVLLNHKAAEFFSRSLYSEGGTEARDYLYRKRGLSEDVVKSLGVGYAPDSFDRLKSYLLKCGFSGSELTEYSLCNRSENGHIYDAFRNRVMFPIRDVNGNVVAFGGRALGDSGPKYLNSGETPIYRKGRHLFGLHTAKEHGRGAIILCEGYMDAIALNSVGIMNVAATLGTALTDEQAELLKRHTKRVFINFDSDNAGKAATERALSILEKVGLTANIVRLENAKDPDEYIKSFGKDAYVNEITKSINAFEFRLDLILNKYDLSEISNKIHAAEEIVSMISKNESAVAKYIYSRMAAEKLGISAEAIMHDVQKAENTNS